MLWDSEDSEDLEDSKESRSLKLPVDRRFPALLSRNIEDGATPETEETPDQFVIRLNNYLAKWLELSGSSPENFDALI